MVWALFVIGFGLAYVLGGQLLHDLAEGMDRAHLALWKMELPLVTLLVAVAAAFIRRKAEVCERGHDAGLWRPIRAPKAAEILAGEGTTRRVALRTLGASGATVAAAAGGLGAAVLNDRGWLPVAHDFFMPDVEVLAKAPQDSWKGAHVQNYRRPAAPRPWCRTSRSAPAASAAPAPIPTA